MRRVERIKIICKWCKKDFYARESRNRIFCSIQCKREWQKTIFGEKHKNYKGGFLNGQGYKMTKIKGSDIFIHRIIIEKYLGRKLEKDEVVHHINGNKLDNRVENLKVMLIAEHLSLHHRKYI